jgi:predicted RecA/RadA family phage recombinase
VAAGAVVLIGNKVMISKRAISANVKGALHVKGVFRFPKDASVFAAGDAVYWNPTGNPVGGTAGSGAATSTPTAYFAGYVPPTAPPSPATRRWTSSSPPPSCRRRPA